MTLMYDPESGDLGTGDLINPEQFFFLVRFVEKILNDIKKEFEPKWPLKYCFKIGVSAELLKSLISRAEEVYGVEFYSVDGIKVFGIRGESGGVVSAYVCYLIVR